MDQSKFEGWAVVELFGHQSEIGFVTTEAFGTAVMFRVDTPDLPERDEILKTPEYLDTQYVPKGSTVRRAAAPGRTRIVGPGAIYAINPCTEEAARAAIEARSRRPMMLLKLAGAAAELAAPVLFPNNNLDDGDENEMATD